jgi:CRISPR-associated protein Cmr2
MNYIALTIGPIYKTLKNSKKPKELWSGSFVFSYVMREIISNFKDREFITPYIKDESIFKDGEVGLFHDRFIFKSKENDIYKLKSVIEEVLNDLSKKLNIDEKITKEYLQINYDEYSLDDDKNPITEISPYLDTKELFFETSQNSAKFIEAIKNKENFLLEDKNIVDDLKKLCHKKYYCVVHADGDNMSKAIEGKNNIEKVSKNLFEYCKASNRFIKEFGGQTIFAGGDDLLFFAPTYKNGKTIFELCDEISQDFEKRFNGVATLSFGVTINYVKFPLYEALENSREQLFAKAKNEQKNNIAFKVTKHSGQSFESIIHKGNKVIYDKFLTISSNIKDDDKDADNFLHSLHHKIDTYKTTLEQIANNKERLKNFFTNYFNKDLHKEYKSFFETLSEFIYEIYQDDSIKKEEKLNMVYATLRFVKFIKGDKG